MNSLIESPMILVIVILATWRMSLMLTAEEGVFSFAFAIRLLGNEVITSNVSKFKAWKMSLKPVGSEGFEKIIVKPSNHFGKLLSCIMCTSVWIAIIFVLGLEFFHLWYVQVIYYSLAVSGASIIVQKKGLS